MSQWELRVTQLETEVNGVCVCCMVLLFQFLTCFVLKALERERGLQLELTAARSEGICSVFGLLALLIALQLALLKTVPLPPIKRLRFYFLAFIMAHCISHQGVLMWVQRLYAQCEQLKREVDEMDRERSAAAEAQSAASERAARLLREMQTERTQWAERERELLTALEQDRVAVKVHFLLCVLKSLFLTSKTGSGRQHQ